MERFGGYGEKEHLDVIRVLRRLGACWFLAVCAFVAAFVLGFWCLIGWGIYYLAGIFFT